MTLRSNNERLRCPFCGGVAGYIGPQTIPNDSALVVTYATEPNTTTVQVTAVMAKLGADRQSEDEVIADLFHDCQMVRPA